MKDPKQCNNIEEIRQCLDEIDFQIIELLGNRLNYIKEIVKFKLDEKEIIANARQKEVINLRREWAENNNLDPGLIESLYKTLIEFNIKKELKIFRKLKS
jgi:isochorismate pyruvate lyase